ncbi:MAG: hypothetical protein AAF394_12935 [Planctomycetota bacterium]
MCLQSQCLCFTFACWQWIAPALSPPQTQKGSEGSVERRVDRAPFSDDLSVERMLPTETASNRKTGATLLESKQTARQIGRFQIALFVGEDAASQQLLDWFEQNVGLRDLKSKCEFQVYRIDNPLYQSRYKQFVPASQFPVVLFQDSQGSHVHAAGNQMLPGSASELLRDLQYGYALYQQTREAEISGAMKTRGYSWDDAISPDSQLDLPNQVSPRNSQINGQSWDSTPSKPNQPFTDREDSRNALFWANAEEMVTMALIFVALVLFGYILLKRGA